MSPELNWKDSQPNNTITKVKNTKDEHKRNSIREGGRYK